MLLYSVLVNTMATGKFENFINEDFTTLEEAELFYELTLLYYRNKVRDGIKTDITITMFKDTDMIGGIIVTNEGETNENNFYKSLLN